MTQTAITVLRAGQAKEGWLGGLGARFLVPGADTGERFSLVDHPLRPRALAAPLHRHTREDEYSLILEGRVGAELGGEVVHAEPGDLVYKPRGEWHTFWNAGDQPARLLEMISPAGFEHYFEEVIALFEAGRAGPDTIPPIAARYGLELDFASIGRLCAEHGLVFGEHQPA